MRLLRVARVSDGREIVGRLHAVGAEHGEAGLAAGHDVGVIAEDRQGMGGEGSGRHVHDEGRQLAGDLVHVRDHQQQALRRGERRGERAGLQGAVDSAGGAAFGLHLGHRGNGSPDVLLALGGPFVGELAHGARRRDRINRDYFTYTMGNGGYRLVAIQRQHRSFWCGHSGASVLRRREGFKAGERAGGMLVPLNRQTSTIPIGATVYVGCTKLEIVTAIEVVLGWRRASGGRLGAGIAMLLLMEAEFRSMGERSRHSRPPGGD